MSEHPSPLRREPAGLGLVLACLLAAWAAWCGAPPPVWAEPAALGSSIAAESPPNTDAEDAPTPARVRGLSARSDGRPVPEYDRPPGARPGDGGPSPVIFPAQTLTLRFNHLRHVLGLGLLCTSCHERARTSHDSADSLLPPPERCDGCHGTDHRDRLHVASGASVSGQCGFCHLGYDSEHPGTVERLSIPKPNLHFDHALHAQRNIACAQCHGAVENLELATRDQLPRMQGCLRCHQAGDASAEPRATCDTCHLREASGLLRSSFPAGTLSPPAWLHDARHGPDWIERHKRVAGDDARFCGNCHSQKYCADCHDGRVRPRHVHPNDWLSMHPVAARQNSPSCASCHREQSFCLGCHQRAGVAFSGPFANFAQRGRFHPPKSQWTDGPSRSPGHHAWEAERNISACVSCHVERDCAICHASASVGGRGVNPHPAGFLGRCGRALAANARSCLVCHDPSELSACR